MHRHNTSHRLRQFACLTAALLGFSACFSLDVGPGQSNCPVEGQNGLSANPYGFTVFVNLPASCPFDLQSFPMTQSFAATIFADGTFISENAQLFHHVVNFQGIGIKDDETPWRESVNGRIVSNISAIYYAGSGGFFQGQSTGSGHDRWYVTTDAVEISGQTTPIRAAVLLTYYRLAMASVAQSAISPNPYSQITLNVVPPIWLPEPRTYSWYRDGTYIGEFGESLVIMTAGPNESVNFEVIVTGSDASQVRGGRTVTSRESTCDETQVICN